MWELDAAEIFGLNRPALLARIPLVSSERSDWKRAAKQIVATGNPALAGAFVSLGGLRYDRTELEGVLDKVTLEEFIPKDWIRQSSVVEPFIEQAEKEGRISEARRMLTRAIVKRFPGLVVPDAIQMMPELEAIEDLHEAIVVAASRGEAEAIILRIAAPRE